MKDEEIKEHVPRVSVSRSGMLNVQILLHLLPFFLQAGYCISSGIAMTSLCYTMPVLDLHLYVTQHKEAPTLIVGFYCNVNYDLCCTPHYIN